MWPKPVRVCLILPHIQIQIVHLLQEFHKTNAFFFSLHPITWYMLLIYPIIDNVHFEHWIKVPGFSIAALFPVIIKSILWEDTLKLGKYPLLNNFMCLFISMNHGILFLLSAL